jgi:hypothetical protein
MGTIGVSIHTATLMKFNHCRSTKMRDALLKVFVGLAITSIAMFGADNSVGTWKRNVQKSKSTPVANPITSLTIVREAVEGGVKVTATGQRQDGTSINASYTVKYNGLEYPVTGASWDTTSMKQVNANTFTTENKKKDGKYHTTGRTTISKDGKKMTVTAKGTDDEGKPYSATTIYEKQ